MSRLRLREVRLSGFKTFADKTTIAFTPGITAIVGPNGSGKSNIVDALRWALGEAGRGIRSKRVDEVIFAGSEKRRQLGLAEVSLSISNDDGLFDLPFTEIEIARRADRGGGQEYLRALQRMASSSLGKARLTRHSASAPKSVGHSLKSSLGRLATSAAALVLKER